MKKTISSFKFAWNGILLAFKERNFRIQFVVGFLSWILGIYFIISRTEWLILILFSALVLGLEIVNTAIEKTCDLICSEQNESIKTIKDLSAGAVLLVSILSLAAGIIIFLPKFIAFFS